MSCAGRSRLRGRRRRHGRAGTPAVPQALRGGAAYRGASASRGAAIAAHRSCGSGRAAPASPSWSAPGELAALRTRPARRRPAHPPSLGSARSSSCSGGASATSLRSSLKSNLRFSPVSAFGLAVAEGTIQRIVGSGFIFCRSHFRLLGWIALPRVACILSSGARSCTFRSWYADFRLGHSRAAIPATGSRLTMSLSTGDLSALGARPRSANRARRLRLAVCALAAAQQACALCAGTGSALNTCPHREHLKVGVSSGRTRSSIR